MQRPRRHHDELLRRANGALEQQDFGEAEAQARRALMLRPDSHEARGALSSALIEQARYDEAAGCLAEMLAEEPEDLAALADLGLCLFELCEFSAAEAALSQALELEPHDPQASYWMALCLERRGQFELSERYFRVAHEIDPDAYPCPVRISREEFATAVASALEELPDELRAQMLNISILVEDLPREDDLRAYDPPLDPCLYGLFVGVPLAERGQEDLPEVPATIFIYQRNLERFCGDRETLLQEIRLTLLHEIGHFLGFDEEELADRGLA